MLPGNYCLLTVLHCISCEDDGCIFILFQCGLIDFLGTSSSLPSLVMQEALPVVQVPFSLCKPVCSPQTESE